MTTRREKYPIILSNLNILAFCESPFMTHEETLLIITQKTLATERRNYSLFINEERDYFETRELNE